MADVKRTHAVITVPDNGPELQSESHCHAILKDRLLFEFNTDVYENKGKYLGDILNVFEFLSENLKVKKKNIGNLRKHIQAICLGHLCLGLATLFFITFTPFPVVRLCLDTKKLKQN